MSDQTVKHGFSLSMLDSSSGDNVFKADFEPLQRGMYRLRVFVGQEQKGDFWPLSGASAVSIVEDWVMPTLKQLTTPDVPGNNAMKDYKGREGTS